MVSMGISVFKIDMMIGIDLFSGSGGLSLGAAQAGIDIRLAVESDYHAAATYSHNHPKTNIFISNIENLIEIEVDQKDSRTILFGGPPCQGFSTSNRRTRKLKNPINWLFTEFLRVARMWKPDWIVLENVTGIRDTERGIFLEQILTGLAREGYTISWFVLNALDYGVPQRRSRLFIIGSLDGISLTKPDQVVFENVTVREAILDLPDLINGASMNVMPYKCEAKSLFAKAMRQDRTQSSNHLVTRNAPKIIERYGYIPQGGNWQNIPCELMRNYSDLNKCHTGIYYRLREDAPAVVIGNYRKNMLIHPTQDRGLSVREAARLQSFPDWYEFKGSIGFQQQQVGNAVPPLMASAVFRKILSYESNDQKLSAEALPVNNRGFAYVE
jgi:DNA (cytosine-5)-methyltransferase 1